MTTELQTDFAQWLRLKHVSWYHEGNQKSLRTASCQNSCIGQGKICLNMAGGREDWKSTLDLQMFGFLRCAAVFLLWLPRMICPRSSNMGNLLVWKTKTDSLKSPLFPVMRVFSLSRLNAYLVFPVLLISEAKRGLSWPTGSCQREAGAVPPASPGYGWCRLALPSETPSSHICHGNFITALPRPVFTFFVPLVLFLWFFS